ncbi:ABC transporter ATP-binding protein [Marininema halotolerans]|uniref:ABC-2 type transport system ATP-binding protein n=1 Tax=Marininema halotolerans TaxID=1155944 RepID=A0A1I6RNL5_9BACL|nr:ABC transporter ATP-binding protein [Marininema halotolerans]SFS66200.1 ABC-2 type transport system ATP-binding protein [Marininema halotolerans]
MIQLENVSKRYLRKTALTDITFTVPPGSITGIIGENGSGKSTLLKLMAGLVRPSHGTVSFHSKKVTRQIANQVAYLSERELAYSFFTIGEMMNWQASQFVDFDHTLAHEILDFMKLDPKTTIKHLSKGNQARVKILLTLARKAPVILMDEPLSGLDPMVRDSIIKGLISFVDFDRQTLVITTHEVDEMEPLLDQIIAIRQGALIEQIAVEDLRSREGVGIREWMNQTYTKATNH